MTVDYANIASWEESLTPSALDEPSTDEGIATESAPSPDPKWGHCIDALLDTLRALASEDEQEEDAPTHATVKAGLQWLQVLKSRFPGAPPTLVIPEPGGGLIIERRGHADAGEEVSVDITLYNDGRAENTVYRDGHVVHMAPVPFWPSLRSHRGQG